MIGRRIAQLRHRAGMTQRQLAEAAGLNHKTAVSKLERDEHWPSWRTLSNLARALGVPVEELLKPVEPEPEETPATT